MVNPTDAQRKILATKLLGLMFHSHRCVQDLYECSGVDIDRIRGYLGSRDMAWDMEEVERICLAMNASPADIGVIKSSLAI